MDGSTAENLARIATVIGVLAIPIAWKTLTTTWDTNRASHMNTLFREFLRLEFDYFNQPANQAGQGPAWESLRSYKMWVLEEIWIWLDSQQHRVFPMQPGRANRHRELLAGWDATLKYHLGNRPDQKTWDEFYRNRKCYHKGFVAFAMRHHPCSPFRNDPTIDCAICGERVAADVDWALLNDDEALAAH
ncbi:hypothetical protein MZO42_08105 [Sphingomonas psychrotolerans]|uniref:Uncharacterized protein n=1 Tax=Sphingomonas psychrotolerans TaxID=1327635 RepID=A0ABU3N2G5_9SPHN|nr:hypothetical protein [Sphingomonas psychrotolerans]MDT8758658.1 hypothetical protein [Sphingomonas psychrotolerans]